MNQPLANRYLFGTVATVFVAAALTQTWLAAEARAFLDPGTQMMWLAGPPAAETQTITPDADSDGVPQGVASGPTLPPGPWDEKPETPAPPQIHS